MRFLAVYLVYCRYIYFFNSNQVQLNVPVVCLSFIFAYDFKNVVVNKITIAAVNS